MLTPSELNKTIAEKFPGHLGISITAVDGQQMIAEFDIAEHHMATNGYLHAGSVVSLADTACGLGCSVNLPAGADGFTTVELKSNHLGTAREGKVVCVAKALHLGKSTQVWDAEVKHQQSGKVIAMFRCTQMILYSDKNS
ncbi:MAG: PaaI family thioesterase [Gammaproteobacteria bacterium]|nr:PaaI family thioesterase [Gammaproteobacteria bacterium]NNM10450.1 PaaI family thioesterase [Pseudomonadales bacterium]RZV51377.1 MAG: PaaI family thioesterase [Pseudomonadales bacterium]